MPSRLLSVAVMTALYLAMPGCTRAVNSQIGMPEGRAIKARDIPSQDLISICETGVDTRGGKFTGPDARASICNYAGVLFSGQRPDALSEIVEKDMEKATRYLEISCSLDYELGCQNLKKLADASS